MIHILFVAICSLNAVFIWTFNDDAVGELPKEWTAAKTGQGAGSVWQVVNDAERKVLAQTSSDGPKAIFNLCVADEPRLANVKLSVAVKAVGGKIDQGGGPVWRYQDKNNYYVCRWNPLENNFRVYLVVKGKRKQLATTDIELSTEGWHPVRVEHVGNRIRCYLRDQLLLDVKDDAITAAGRVGLWTKADAVSHFDDLNVQEVKNAE